MDSIIYDSRIDWNALKQRPQYLSEELAKRYNVVYTCMRLYRGETTNNIPCSSLIVKHFNHIPFLDRNSHTKRINDQLRKLYYKRIVKKNNPKLCILSDATKVDIIRSAYKGPIVYDCMDDFVSFDNVTSNQRLEIIDCEERVIKESIVTFVSSNHLLDKIVERYGDGIKNKLVLIRNGCNISDLPLIETEKKTKQRFTLCYFGTIGTWFDVEIIKRSLKDFENLDYLIIGNIKPGIEIGFDPRIKLVGSVPHNKLAIMAKECNAFVMPFIVNDVVLSVDPVKLYEYISLGKDILCVQYPEIGRFSDFVYFYNDYTTYKSQLSKIIASKEAKYTVQQRNGFLYNNTWESRTKEIISSIEQVI